MHAHGPRQTRLQVNQTLYRQEEDDMGEFTYKIRAFFYRLGANPMELSVPRLPQAFDVWVEIGSGTSDRNYIVNLFEYSCTCPDYLKRRQYFYPGDVRRVCKHQFALMEERGLVDQLDELSRAVLKFGANRKTLRRLENKAGVAFALSTDTWAEWVDVVTRKKRVGEKGGAYSGEYDVYGYNNSEKRWSYGEAPAGARAIKSAIRHELRI